MALKAGYYGVKRSVLRVIEGLAGSKIIKSIGNGLKLTNAGTLSVDIDTDTMEFKNGKLSGKAGLYDFQNIVFETGQKWIDGKNIYGKSYSFDTVTDNMTIDSALSADNIIMMIGTYHYVYQSQSEIRVLPEKDQAITTAVYYDVAAEALKLRSNFPDRTQDLMLTIFFTKEEV